MSTKDEVGIVVKCLRLGAADFLMKPLRTNELLNLWTHMWRRKKIVSRPEYLVQRTITLTLLKSFQIFSQSGLVERRRINGLNINDRPLDILLQEASESNTNSTDLFSDDTDEKRKMDKTQSVNLSGLDPDKRAGAIVRICTKSRP